MKLTTRATLALALAAGPRGYAATQDPHAAELRIEADSITVRPRLDCESVSVAISGPRGGVAERAFPCNGVPVVFFREAGMEGDGVYTYEVRLSATQRDEGTPLVESGYFRVKGGAVVVEDAAAPTEEPRARTGAAGPQPDATIADDLIVKGRICAGVDCTSGETFDFDTLRLKASLPSIKFIDTGTGAGARDWQIFTNTFYSSVDRFAITDLGSGRTPFAIRGNAPAHALYLDPAGKVGFGTSTPAVPLHLKVAQLPALRLEQTGGSGFATQTWHLGVGYQGNFFIGDITHSGTPLDIEAGAPLGSLRLRSSGSVGLGTPFPAASAHVFRSDGTAKLLVEDAIETAVAARVLLELKNTGPITMRFNNASAGNFWGLGNNGAENFFVTSQTSTGLALQLEPDGDLTIQGTLTQGSDRDSKDGFAELDPQTVLDTLADLPIGSWHRKSDPARVRHVGPTAQDFAAAFGLGDDERRIAPLDVSGVALLAIQALDAQVKALERRNRELSERVELLENPGRPR